MRFSPERANLKIMDDIQIYNNAKLYFSQCGITSPDPIFQAWYRDCPVINGSEITSKYEKRIKASKLVKKMASWKPDPTDTRLSGSPVCITN